MSIQDDVINKTFEQIRRIQDSEISQGVSSDELHINLKTLGAKGDGIADDTTYVRSALDFAVITAKGATESDAKTKGFMPDTFDVLQKLSDDQCAIKIK